MPANTIRPLDNLELQGPTTLVQAPEVIIRYYAEETHRADSEIFLSPDDTLVFAAARGGLINPDGSDNFGVTEFWIREEVVEKFKTGDIEEKRKIARDHAGVVVSPKAKELLNYCRGRQYLDIYAAPFENLNDEIAGRRDGQLSQRAREFVEEFEANKLAIYGLLRVRDVSREQFQQYEELMQKFPNKIGQGYLMLTSDDIAKIKQIAELFTVVAKSSESIVRVIEEEIASDREQLQDVDLKVTLLEDSLE